MRHIMPYRSRIKFITMIVAFLLMISDASGGTGAVANLDNGTMSFQVDSQWVELGSGMYLPIRVRIRNRGGDDAVQITFRSSGQPECSRQVTVSQNSMVDVTLNIPVFDSDVALLRFQPEKSARVETRISTSIFNNHGAGYGSYPRHYSSHNSSSAVEDRSILAISQSTGLDSTRLVRSLLNWNGTIHDEYFAVVRPDSLPDSWLGYTGICLAMVSTADLKKIPTQSREALMSWVRTGGLLIVHSAKPTEHGYHEDKELLSLLGAESLSNVDQWDTYTYWDGCSSADVQRGKVAIIRSDPWFIGSEGAECVEFLAKKLGMNYVLMPRVYDPDEDFASLAIPGVGVPPIGVFITLISVFSILIGPVNYFLCWRRKQLFLLLLTIPLLAMASIVSMFAYSMISDGFGMKSRIRSLTLVDQSNKKCVSMARACLFAGIGGAGTLKQTSDTAVGPIVTSPNFAGSSINWSNGQEMTGWIKPRTVTQFLLVSQRDERGRLEVTAGKSGQLSVNNGFSTGLTKLVVVDQDGVAWYGENIPAGGISELQKLTDSQRAETMQIVLESNLVPRKRHGAPVRRTRSPILEDSIDVAVSRFLKEKSEPNSYFGVFAANPGVNLGAVTYEMDSQHFLSGTY